MIPNAKVWHPETGEVTVHANSDGQILAVHTDHPDARLEILKHYRIRWHEDGIGIAAIDGAFIRRYEDYQERFGEVDDQIP